MRGRTWATLALLSFDAALVATVWRGVVKPTRKLAYAMQRVSRSDFWHELDPREGKLLADVYRNYNDMIASLSETEAFKEEFVSNVAHEFKTPLMYIQGYATLLQDDDLTPEEYKEYASNIVLATRRLSSVVGNLLELASLRRPGERLQTERVELDEQLRHAVSIFMPQIEAKDIRYELDLHDIEIVGNESLLNDVWENLISNAVKFTSCGDAIAICARREGNDAVVTIADTGCGMDEKQARHVFDRFYQGDSTHGGEGTGLGLPIVDAVVKKHGGTVNVESELGSGTTFTVRLPIGGPDQS